MKQNNIPQMIAHQQRFSLVELLVVISILAVLSSLLQASLRKTMEAATDISCLNNIRAMTNASLFFADDHDDLFPGSGYNSGSGIGQRVSFSPSPAPQTKSLLIVQDYLVDETVFQCPSSMSQKETLYSTFMSSVGWNKGLLYGFNIYFVGDSLHSDNSGVGTWNNLNSPLKQTSIVIFRNTAI